MSFAFGKSATTKYQSMISDNKAQDDLLKNLQTYNLNIQEAVQVAQNAKNIIQAYLSLFKNKSFSSVFYNYSTQKDEFQKVYCRSFEDLQKKAEQQEKDVKRIGCICNILDKALLQIQDQRLSNRAFLKDIMLRQMQINISIINKLKGNVNIDDKGMLKDLTEAINTIQQAPNKLNPIQLKAYIDIQNEVIYSILHKIQGYM